jgi:hypothetical protein
MLFRGGVTLLESHRTLVIMLAHARK